MAAALGAAACDEPVVVDVPLPPGEITSEPVVAPFVGIGVTDNTDNVTMVIPPTIGPDPCANCPPVGDPPPGPCQTYVCNDMVGRKCVLTNVMDGTPCDDNNACTDMSTCREGVCVGQTSDCPPPTEQCQELASCDPAGGCVYGPRPNGSPCSDGNMCTRSDTCQQGACMPGSPVVCAPLDQCHMVGVCSPQTGACSDPPKPNGTNCNDGKDCTRGEKCNAGACTGGTVECPALGQCHLPGACDAAGKCTTPTKPDNDPCNDINACTSPDRCIGGVCMGQGLITCPPPPNDCHDEGVCHFESGECFYGTKPLSTPCNDGMLCTYGDACAVGGVCRGTPIVCMDDEFADRECDGTQSCKVTPKPGAACDDGNACTRGDVRRGDGSCAGMPYTCEAQGCIVNSRCDGNGGCIQEARPDGFPCDADGSKCTPMDRCQGGVCVRDPQPVTCVIRDCNRASCNPATGNCEYAATSNEPCGVTGCFSTGTCQNGTCSGVPKDCSNLDGPCSTGICDARTGGCVATHKPNGMSCDPGGMCAAGAVCAFGVCQPAPAACPAPMGPCKLVSCDPATGACVERDKAVGASCDPKTACMGPGDCDDRGRCRGAPAANGAACTTSAGAIGLCAAGSCAAVGGPDGGVDAAGGGDGSSRRGGGGGCDCSVASSGRHARSLLAVLAILVVLLARHRRGVRDDS